MEAAKILLKHVSESAGQDKDSKMRANFLIGEFNSEPIQQAYQTLTDEGPSSLTYMP